MSSLKKVCLVGANGSLGKVLLKGLVEASCFDISILRRSNSTSTTDASLPAPLNVLSVSPEYPIDELVSVFRGQDAVVLSFRMNDVQQHLRIVEAAFKAGVKRVVPSDWGSCDAASRQAQDRLQIYRDKNRVQMRCEDLAASAATEGGGGGVFTWSSIVCGHFFDEGLRDGLLHFNLDTHTAQILDGGAIKASASTLRRIAESLVRTLQRPDPTANRKLYVQSFCPTQLEIYASLERATGKVWHQQSVDSNAFLDRETRRLREGHKDAEEHIVFVLGTVDADWTTREGFAMGVLGLEDENMDEVIDEVVAMHKKEKAA
jgi:hypothetical protein